LASFSSLQMSLRAFSPSDLHRAPLCICFRKTTIFSYKQVKERFSLQVEGVIRYSYAEDNPGVAILSAIPKRFELLVYKGMYNVLKDLISINQHSFMKNRSTITKLLEYAYFVLNLIVDANQIPSIRIFQRLLIVCAINCC
jgi:hypothetical protein